MPSNWLLSIASGQLIVFLGVAWKVVAFILKRERLLEEFPPHRHINGTKILYPKEYQPSHIEIVQ